MSLQELSARTRIKEALLDALERGDIELLPRGPFARGFARAYAGEVGLDAEELLAQCRPEPLPAEPLPLPASREPVLESRVPVARLAMSAVVVLAALVVPRWLTPAEDSAARNQPAVEQAAGVLRTVGTAGVVAADAPASGAPVPATQPQAALTFVLRAESEVWVEGTADDAQVAYDLLPAGAERIFTADRSLALRIGDAGAIAYTINGRPGVSLGGPGQVRDIVISPDTIGTFQVQAPQ